MIYKILRHADPVILYNEDIITISVTECGLLHNAEGDGPPCRRIFHRIAQKIDKYLVDLQGIRDHILIGHLKGIDKQF